MEVSVVYREKKYRYERVGSIMTWVDESQVIVPVMLHSLLRERAISSGVVANVFLSEVPTEEELKEIKQKLKEEKVSKVSKTNKKKNLMGGFNPFK